jgi:ABC-type nitrate/sulfonate/bicarbonate transport system permease component
MWHGLSCDGGQRRAAVTWGRARVRVMEGFALAAVLVWAWGGLGIFPQLRRADRRTIQALRPIPRSLAAVAILWFGIEEGSKVSLSRWERFFPRFRKRARRVPRRDGSISKLQVLEVPRAIHYPRCYPGALPFIAAGLRIGMG